MKTFQCNGKTHSLPKSIPASHEHTHTHMAASVADTTFIRERGHRQPCDMGGLFWRKAYDSIAYTGERQFNYSLFNVCKFESETNSIWGLVPLVQGVITLVKDAKGGGGGIREGGK